MDISIATQSRNLEGLLAVSVIAFLVAISVPVPGLVVGSTIFVAGTLALYAGLGLAYQKEKTSRNISTGLIVLAGLITFTVVFLVLKAIADPIV
ncbi:hypothetical protein ACG98H_09355 [Corynebacterium sp. L4756]|uniref:hypothetical protein n=1 Tax=unclassified Corynebacterium TaxID=2624378 RepID=UPI00374C9D36